MENNFDYNKQFGCFQIARSLFHDEIWLMKPAWWVKVWIYLIGKANHTDYNEKIKRGDFLTSYQQIYTECNLLAEGVHEGAVDNFIRFLKETKKATTRKTTRGLIITILNYDLYQTISNFENDTENEIQTKSKRHANDRINKNERMKKEDVTERLANISQSVDAVFAHYLTVSKTEEKLLPSRKKKIQARLKTFTVDEINTAINKCFADDFYNGTTNDRGWRANANYMFRSDEVIDKHLNTSSNQKITAPLANANPKDDSKVGWGWGFEEVMAIIEEQNKGREAYESY